MATCDHLWVPVPHPMEEPMGWLGMTAHECVHCQKVMFRWLEEDRNGSPR